MAREPRRLTQARTATFGRLIAAELADRPLYVWLPPDLAGPDDRRSVVYCFDGQGMFSGGSSISGDTWELDAALWQLARGGVRLPIVVAIESPAKRRAEYMPAAGLHALPKLAEIFVEYNGIPRSDEASDTIVNVIKPVIDSLYPTLPDRDNTFLMGSSMGGLFSIYNMSRHPDVFGAAAALSLHWAISGVPLVHAMSDMLPDPSSHRLYTDHGTLTLDARYLDKQPVFDALVRQRGWVDEDNYLSLVFPRTRHTERHWAARVVVPLTFLLVGTKTAAGLAEAFGGMPTPPEVPGELLRPVGR
jgi:predicted alpha/beta superfamily hydrolase